MIPRFHALACQTIIRPVTEAVGGRDEGRAIIRENLEAAHALMWKGLGNNLGAVRLVTFPATRTLKMSPTPRSKISSAGVRESMQLRTTASGCWPAAVA